VWRMGNARNFRFARKALGALFGCLSCNDARSDSTRVGLDVDQWRGSAWHSRCGRLLDQNKGKLHEKARYAQYSRLSGRGNRGNSTFTQLVTGENAVLIFRCSASENGTPSLTPQPRRRQPAPPKSSAPPVRTLDRERVRSVDLLLIAPLAFPLQPHMMRSRAADSAGRMAVARRHYQAARLFVHASF
jgi:hypothetical protein